MFYQILLTNDLRKHTEIRVENCYMDIEGWRNHYSAAYLTGCTSVDCRRISTDSKIRSTSHKKEVVCLAAYLP